ncbi:MAG TPA: hypothetical protein VND93_22755 [Myxococcales bacterium]|jgi:hypothetical protein|nr:hypothetical protein [Myxococcales bacterium]
MRTNLLAAAVAALLSLPAFAQVEVKISFPWAAPPPLVVVEPGIQVVPDYDEEVFFVDGWYWVRRDGRWFHARDYRAGWVFAPAPPATLVRLPPGKYRRWKAEKAIIKQEVKAERREEKREVKEMKRVGPPGRGGHKK